MNAGVAERIKHRPHDRATSPRAARPETRTPSSVCGCRNIARLPRPYEPARHRQDSRRTRSRELRVNPPHASMNGGRMGWCEDWWQR